MHRFLAGAGANPVVCDTLRGDPYFPLWSTCRGLGSGRDSPRGQAIVTEMWSSVSHLNDQQSNVSHSNEDGYPGLGPNPGLGPKTAEAGNAASCSLFSLTYGEETKLQLTVCAADFEINALMTQRLAIVDVRLTVCNNLVSNDIEATLRLPLPDSDATISEFSVGTDHAIAVPKAKANEVAYKEKEKGGAVATANKVSGATWETTVYPLPFNKQVKVTVQFVCNMAEDGQFALPLVFPSPVERITVSAVDEDGLAGVHNLNGHATRSTMPDGLRVSFTPAATNRRIVSAERGGSLFWSGRVPKEELDLAFADVQATVTPDAAALTDETRHVGIIVDTSRSCKPMANEHLACLAALDTSYASCGRRVHFTVWSFSCISSCLGERMNIKDAHNALAKVQYNGGTNLSLLGGESGLLKKAGPLGKQCDVVVLLTDGVNNLLTKQMPDIGGAGVAAVPIHVPLPPTGFNANLALLRWLAYQTGGSAVMRLDEPHAFADVVSGATTQTVLTRLTLDISGDLDALMDEKLQTTPDWRLDATRNIASADGSLRFSGVCSTTSGRTPPASVTLHVQRGGAVVILTLPIPKHDGKMAVLGRLLQVQHTLLSLARLQECHYDPEACAAVAAEMACTCVIASEHSSLLKLSKAEQEPNPNPNPNFDPEHIPHPNLISKQFADNDIVCPAEHSAYAAWLELVAQREQERVQRKATEAARQRHKIENEVALMSARFENMLAGREDAHDMQTSVSANWQEEPAFQSLGSEEAEDQPAFRSLGSEEPGPLIMSSPMPPPMPISQSSLVLPTNPVPNSSNPREAVTAAAEPAAPSAKRTKRDSKEWEEKMVATYDNSGLDEALKIFDLYLEKSDPVVAAQPSMYIKASELLHERGVDGHVCANVLFNVLETKLPDTQVCRVVAYHLLSYGCFDDAVALLELVRETLAPAEPHSFTDLAFVRFHRLRTKMRTKIDENSEFFQTAVTHTRGEMARVVADLTTVLTGTEWPERFKEIEWPVLILLSWAVAWAEYMLPELSNLWPEEQLPADKYRLGGPKGPQLDIFVWLGWDTDHTDVDLHVKEPTGEEVCYSHNRSLSTGARVSRDFIGGYGPEVYTLPRAPKGTYNVETNYYESHQASCSTGSTSAVVWSITNMGRFETEVINFSSVRLVTQKQRQEVLTITIK